MREACGATLLEKATGVLRRCRLEKGHKLSPKLDDSHVGPDDPQHNFLTTWSPYMGIDESLWEMKEGV